MMKAVVIFAVLCITTLVLCQPIPDDDTEFDENEIEVVDGVRTVSDEVEAIEHNEEEGTDEETEEESSVWWYFYHPIAAIVGSDKNKGLLGHVLSFCGIGNYELETSVEQEKSEEMENDKEETNEESGVWWYFYHPIAAIFGSDKNQGLLGHILSFFGIGNYELETSVEQEKSGEMENDKEETNEESGVWWYFYHPIAAIFGSDKNQGLLGHILSFFGMGNYELEPPVEQEKSDDIEDDKEGNEYDESDDKEVSGILWYFYHPIAAIVGSDNNTGLFGYIRYLFWILI